MKNLFLLLFIGWGLSLSAQIKHVYQENKTFTYEEIIAAYTELSGQFPQAQLNITGTTDSGKPLHAFIIDQHEEFDPEKSKKRNKRILLVNNGIHPGEPCGIDASIWWAEKLLTNKDPLLQTTTIVIIPVYNTGGAINRGCCSRVNQNGPEQYGFRGNAKNLDLNRDFIKTDSENARSFVRLFHKWSPDIFIDTHSTNGADYSYPMTLIGPNKHKMNPLLGSVAERDLLPFLYQSMKAGGFEMVPYVNTPGKTPESGIHHFCDAPRYSSGYANLFHTISFTSEAHMLKPYKDRVLATALLLQSLLEMSDKYGELIVQLRANAQTATAESRSIELNHRVDTSSHELLLFKGYEAVYRTSPVTGQEQHYYDRESPYQKEIPYFNKLRSDVTTNLPEYYIIPQAWKEVAELLKLNGVVVQQLSADEELDVDVQYIMDFNTSERSYEGHYLHRDVTTITKQARLRFYEGDYVIRTNQASNNYIATVLDPRSEDSFFCWNFFDAVLMQKEWFSSYLFDVEAEQLLKDDDELRAKFMAKKKDPEFAADAWSQLYFIYQNSPNYEATHNRYPVFELRSKLQDVKLK